jgi:hypothetical protein
LAELEGYIEKIMRRVDRRDLASLMAQYFKGDRQEMNRRIEDQMGALRSNPSVDSRHSVSSSRAPTVIDLLRQRMTSGMPPSPPEVGAWFSRNRRYLLAGSAGALVVLAAIVTRVRGRTNGPPVAAPAIAVVTPQVADAKPAAPAAPADERPKLVQIDTIRLSIKVEPPSATLQLDGRKLAGNPFQADLQREPRGSHLLRATAPGYYPMERTINLARDVNVIVNLRPMPAVPAPAPRAQRRADNDSPPAPRAEPRDFEPGADLRQEAPRSGRRIDEKDPYAR